MMTKNKSQSKQATQTGAQTHTHAYRKSHPSPPLLTWKFILKNIKEKDWIWQNVLWWMTEKCGLEWNPIVSNSLSHTHCFLVPIWADRTSDGTVCVRVSVWVWGKWKVKVAVGTIPPCPPLHPHHIFHHPTILRQLAVGCPSLALFLLYSSFFSIEAPKLPADYSHKGNHLRVDAQVTLMHRPRPYTAHALIHMNSCKYTHTNPAWR